MLKLRCSLVKHSNNLQNFISNKTVTCVKIQTFNQKGLKEEKSLTQI